MKIKEKPEDFIVKEKLTLPVGEGPYAYYVLKKKQWSTADAVRAIANKLGIQEKRISYAGLKDKQAVTEQFISILNGKEKFEKVRIKDIELMHVGNGAERVHTGQLEGNHFEIIVRETGTPEQRKVMPNYFDEQRFGVENTNAEVGKAMVRKDFKKACKTLKLQVEDNNYIGALQKRGRIISLYLHSYQSRLFNRTLAEHIRKKYEHKELGCGYEQMPFPIQDTKETIKIPLISFDAEPNAETDKVLAEEGIKKEDFIIRQLPELISQTEYREGFAEIKNLKIEDLGNNTKKLIFELGKGSYATVAIKTLFLRNI